MTVKTAEGNAAYADGQDTISLVTNLIAGPLTLTDALQADGFIAASNAYIWNLDLRPFSQVRLSGRVTTLSGSANTPRIQLRYHTAFSTTIGDFKQLGVSAHSQISLAAVGLITTGWIDIVNAARIENCFLALCNIGGDGAADPVVANINAQFR